MIAATPLVAQWSEVEPTIAREENVAEAILILIQATPLVEMMPRVESLITEHRIAAHDVSTLDQDADELRKTHNTAKAAYGQAWDDHDLCDHCPFHKNPMEATA